MKDTILKQMQSESKQTIIGVMGSGESDINQYRLAYDLGKLIAKEGWILLNGGRNCGVMDASAKGAKENGGLTIGILPDTHTDHVSPWIDIPILTGMGIARNAINVLSSNYVVACSGGTGTISEVAMALKMNRKVIMLGWPAGKFFFQFGEVHYSDTPEQAIEYIRQCIQFNNRI
ncbi:MAG: Rossmann fold nucleotide-binding protein [Candidatus Magnetoglobus multicellularis str. Araruama]|uniref:Rossmann fold nucleotide-binding protein n=1 Tax=Candidatus Magnetoglobus multicellularis str. Araruama TaxID=890399 RepID=A0A1V1P3G1_9BACT|nr:MAG: Rossmann fold nucleotide-binding protein [Candidatus Magnetoglobus multicellularis str. Araruama]